MKISAPSVLVTSDSRQTRSLCSWWGGGGWAPAKRRAVQQCSDGIFEREVGRNRNSNVITDQIVAAVLTTVRFAIWAAAGSWKLKNVFGSSSGAILLRQSKATMQKVSEAALFVLLLVALHSAGIPSPRHFFLLGHYSLDRLPTKQFSILIHYWWPSRHNLLIPQSPLSFLAVHVQSGAHMSTRASAHPLLFWPLRLRTLFMPKSWLLLCRPYISKVRD